MDRLMQVFLHMNQLDEDAKKQTWLHHLHPTIKMVSCFLMLIWIISSHQINELLIYFLMLIVLCLLSDMSFKKVMKRSLIGLPFSLCIGLSHLIFNHQMISFYGMMVTEGFVLCMIVLLKTALCISYTYLLIITTSFDVITSQLIYMKVPPFFVLQLTMTYRYIFVFLNEAHHMSQAYLLRCPDVKAIQMKDIGSFIGHLLVKSMNESQHIYQCMKCRGFDIATTYQRYQVLDSENRYLLMMMVSVMIMIKVVFL